MLTLGCHSQRQVRGRALRQRRIRRTLFGLGCFSLQASRRLGGLMGGLVSSTGLEGGELAKFNLASRLKVKLDRGLKIYIYAKYG
ncbi:MAG: hypothetical protein ACI8U3_001973 [Brevundimonas sp.]